MLLTKLTCPACRVVLKPNRPVPAGTTVACPQCKAPFRAAGDGAIQSASSPAAPSLPNGAALPPPSPPVSPPTAVPPPFAPTAEPAASGNNKRLALILGGLALGAVLFGVLLVILLGGGSRAEDHAAKDKDKEPEDIDSLDSFSIDKRVRKPRVKPLVELEPEEEKRVKEMTDRGVDYLRKTQRPDGSWAPLAKHLEGPTAMAALTLLSCEVKADDEAVQKAAKFIRGRRDLINQTYDLALCVLMLDRLDDPADKELLETLTFRLITGQTPQGGWGYTCGSVNEKDRDQVSQVLRQLSKQGRALLQGTTTLEQQAEGQKAVESLPPHLKKLGVFSLVPVKTPDTFWRTGGDNSNTQFAVLALWAARKRGLPVDRSLQLAVRRFKSSQNPDGSWNYSGTRNVIPLPTMTCAGLLAMAVEYGVRDKDDAKGPRPEEHPMIKPALVHVSLRLDGAAPPKAGPKFKGGAKSSGLMPLYFLWSVERVGVLFQLEKINGQDWYRWGMKMLQDHQHPDGHWRSGGLPTTDVADTCFALLFLHRVNLAADLTDQLSGVGPKGGP